MEELELSEQCRLGNNQARKELYEQYAGRMLGICLRYTGDRDTAQDLLHDGFLKIFDSFDKFTWRGEGSLRAWMERVMVNTALQYPRKNDVINQSAPLEELPEEYEEPDASDVEALSLIHICQPDTKEIGNKLQEILEPYYRPKYIWTTDCIPQTENGKVNRAKCRILAKQMLTTFYTHTLTP